MRIAIVGKGGSGKTTTAATVARQLARDGHRVVALDCDTNANLGLSLGIGFDPTEQLISMRERLDEGDVEHAADTDQLLTRFGREAPDGVRLAVVSRIEHPDPGCPCCGLSPEKLLAEFDVAGSIAIADLEAGIGTLTRVGPGAIDVAVLVAEPTAKSLEVAERARDLAREKLIPHVLIVANRITGEADLDAIRDRFPDDEVIAVPDDTAITRADREGAAPIDVAPGSPAVIALGRLSAALARTVTARTPIYPALDPHDPATTPAAGTRSLPLQD
jgi:CO dehydrogenase maturation factor